MEFRIVSIDKVTPSPFQPREAFLKEEIEKLAESIKGSGLVQPILVRQKGETYEIIAGERRWRAAQFAGLKEMPVIIREANDFDARELSLIENWHRLDLQPIETEKFVVNLYREGFKTGRYKSINDMSKKTGIPYGTLSELLSSHKERKELELSPVITYTDIRETKVLRDKPDLRKQVLDLREKGELSRDELRQFSKVVGEASEPIRKALLELKIKPEEAKVIESELTTEHEKKEAMNLIETERKPERIVSLVDFIKEIGEKGREIEIIKEVDTGDVWLCPLCKKKYHLIHVKPSGIHRFEEVIE